MLNLFFPQLCCGCDRRLHQGSQLLCVNCKADLALCFPANLTDNSFTRRFYGRLRLESGFSLLRFESTNHCRDLIHQLKYKGKQKLGDYFALWLATLLKQNECIPDFDFVVPVPLHKSRLRKRGYNQVDRFAMAFAKELNVICKLNGLVRTDKSRSSVNFGRSSRFENPHKFSLNPGWKPQAGQHILIVDDTITTGATLEACAKVLLNAGEVKLSFATIAMTQ